MPFEVELWKVQNFYFQAMKELLREERPPEWLDEFLALGDDLVPPDSRPPVKSLRRLAAAYGVLPSYYGIEGLARAHPEALLAVLRALGAHIEREEDAEEALREKRDATARRLAPPVAALWDETPLAVTISHFAGESGLAKLSLTTEGGNRWEDAVDIESQPVAAVRRGVVRRTLALSRSSARLSPARNRLS